MSSAALWILFVGMLGIVGEGFAATGWRADESYLVYFAGYASLCDSSGSGDWYADGRGWGVDCGAEAVS